jgi:hypothetical protein
MLTFLHRFIDKPVGIRVALTPEQWQEVAERSASDYHEWMDAAADAKWIDAARKATFVDARSAGWMVELFGSGVLQ